MVELSVTYSLACMAARKKRKKSAEELEADRIRKELSKEERDAARAEFAKRLESCIENAGFKKKDFADKVGVHPTTVSDWTHERAMPEGAKLSKVAEVLGVSPSFLIPSRMLGRESLEAKARELARRIGRTRLDQLLQIPQTALRNEISLMLAAVDDRKLGLDTEPDETPSSHQR